MSIPFETQDGRRFDRLVDGELPNGERRELLLRLETEPEGWRHCALAFLEAQSWRQAFGSLVSPVAVAARPIVVHSDRRRKPNTRRYVARLTVLAAGLVAAF